MVAFFLNASDDVSDQAGGCGSTAAVNVDAKFPNVGSLGPDQMRNAAIIISVGQQMKVPPRGWIIAIATALQESRLRNLPNLGQRNDHDSVGLFQQRPSQGWGTVEQIMDPVYSTKKFYEKMLQVQNWETRALTDVAQTVQRSAFPDAYAKHELFASLIVNTLAGGAARAVGNLTNLRCAAAGEIAASGWTVPAKGGIVSGFRTASRPTHQGVDIGVPKGTAVHAAAAGTVIRMRCNAIAPDGSDWGCDRDGVTAGARLRLVRRHPARRQRTSPATATWSAVRSSPSGRPGLARSADRLVRFDRALVRTRTCTSRRTSTAVKPKIRRSIPYGSCRTWEHPSEPRRDEL